MHSTLPTSVAKSNRKGRRAGCSGIAVASPVLTRPRSSSFQGPGILQHPRAQALKSYSYSTQIAHLWIALGRGFIAHGVTAEVSFSSDVKADLTVVVAELCSAWMQSHLGECKMLEVRPMLNELESDFHDPPNRTILRFTIEGDDELGVRLRFRADVLQQLQALNPFLLHALHSTLEAAAYRIIPIHTPATVLDLWSYTHWCGASTNAEFVKEQRDMGDDVEESDIGPDDGPDGYCKAFDRFEGMAKSDERAWISREKPKSQERLVARLRRLAKQATPHLRRVIEAVIDVQSMIGTCQPLASLGVRMEDCDEFAERAATVWPPGDDDHEPQVQAMYRAVDDAYHYLYEGGGIGPYSGFDFEQGSTTELTEFFTEYEKTFAAVKAVDALLAFVTTTE